MSQRLDRHSERKYILPSEGVKRDWFDILFVLAIFVFGLTVGFPAGYYSTPRIPHCPRAADVIVGNGEYNSEAGYWSEYHCVSESESAFGDRDVNRKPGK